MITNTDFHIEACIFANYIFTPEKYQAELWVQLGISFVIGEIGFKDFCGLSLALFFAPIYLS